MDNKILMVAGVLIAAAAMIVVGIELLIVLAAFAIVLGILYVSKRIGQRDAALAVILFLAFAITYSFYVVPSFVLAKSQGTILTDNWYEALSWIDNNTKDCAVVATYWDPGHFITALGKRAVVFDGASQGSTIYVPSDGNGQGLVTEKYNNGVVQIKLYNDVGHPDTIRRARIKDIAITLYTDNETQAAEILKDYAKPGCEDEVYYIASADLIGKSTWWSYFATWDPVNKGNPTPMSMLQLQQARPMPGQNAVIYVYPASQDTAFAVIDSNGTLTPFLQQRNQFIKVSKLFYFKQTGEGVLSEQPDAQFPGTLWLDPSRQIVVYMPPEVENSMFTKMFFYHGQDLQHFEFINSWGGEVKLFKVKF